MREGIVNHWTCIYFCMDTITDMDGRVGGGGGSRTWIADLVKRRRVMEICKKRILLITYGGGIIDKWDGRSGSSRRIIMLRRIGATNKFDLSAKGVAKFRFDRYIEGIVAWKAAIRVKDLHIQGLELNTVFRSSLNSKTKVSVFILFTLIHVSSKYNTTV